MRNIIVTLIGILLLSCNQQKKELNFTTQNDLKNKFSVDIPQNWEIINDTINFQSAIFFSDKSKPKNQILTYGIILDSSEFMLNQDFDKFIDTITSMARLEKISGSFEEVNNFKTYKLIFLDHHTTTELGNYETHYYIKKENEKGYLLFSIQRAELNLKKTDSILSERIMKSIKLN